MEPILSVSHLQKVYGDRGSHTRALDDLSFDVLPGEFVGVMGASGSGKTTLLNCVSTIDRPSSGTITVDGTDVTALRGKALSRFRRERLGFVFQDCNLLDTLTAFENIALALTILGTPAGEIDRRVRDTAGLLGLERVLEKYPYQLSGGEQQRIAIARSLLNRPRLIIADEPTGNLDNETADGILRLLTGINKEDGTAIVMVTHNRTIFEKYPGRVFVCKDERCKENLNDEVIDLALTI